MLRIRLLAGLVLVAAGLWALGRWGMPVHLRAQQSTRATQPLSRSL